MKCFTDPWRQVIKEINDAIENAEDNYLPLSSIELTHEEWDAFVLARTTLISGKRLDTMEFDCGTAMYRGIKIYKGKP